MTVFASQKDVARWLEGKPRRVALTFAARAALRVFPMLMFELGSRSDEKERLAVTLPVFRALSLAWTAARYEKGGADFRGDAEIAIRAPFPNVAAGMAAFFAARTVRDADDPHYFYAAIDATASAAKAFFNADRATFGACNTAYESDAAALDQGISPAELAGQQLWPEYAPRIVSEAWERLASALLRTNEDWEVWTEWYADRLRGLPENESLEVARVKIPGEIWERGPKVANAYLERLVEEHSVALVDRATKRMLDFESLEELQQWLRDKPRAVAVVIAARAALRAVPLLANTSDQYGRLTEDAERVTILPVFGAVAASWIASKYPIDREKFRNPARDAARITRAATNLSTEAARGAWEVGAIDNAQAEIVAADVAAAARSAAATSTARKADAAAYAADTVAVVARAAAGAARRSAARATRAVARTHARAARSSVWAATSADAAAIDDENLPPQRLAARPLWPSGTDTWPHGMPAWASNAWNQLSRALYSGNQDWAVWIDWYFERLIGEMGNDALEIARVMISEETWAVGPRAVNAEIRGLMEEHEGKRQELPTEERESLEPVPTQGLGPQFRANEEGLVDRAPPADIDAGGNDTKTINQLRPLVLRCASDLRARLSRNEFPELLDAVQSYLGALDPGADRNVEWSEIWGLGVILQNVAISAERKVESRTLPALEDPAKTALDSLLAMHGPMILATRDGARLSEIAAGFSMTRAQQETLRDAAQRIAERLKASPEVITPKAVTSVIEAAGAIGQGLHPERGSIYGLTTVKNISIVLIGGAAVATPTLIGALLGALVDATVAGTVIGAPFSLVVIEAVKKNPTFNALVTQLGAQLETMSDIELRMWLEERARRLAPFRSFVINNKKHLRAIAEATPELRWMLRYIDFVVGEAAEVKGAPKDEQDDVRRSPN